MSACCGATQAPAHFDIGENEYIEEAELNHTEIHHQSHQSS